MSLIPEDATAATEPATEPVAGIPSESPVAPSFNFSELHEGGVYKEGLDWQKALTPLGLEDLYRRGYERLGGTASRRH